VSSPTFVRSAGLRPRRPKAAHDQASLSRDVRRAITTQRWYLVVAMGRSGHLALGIGKSAGASVIMRRKGSASAAMCPRATEPTAPQRSAGPAIVWATSSRVSVHAPERTDGAMESSCVVIV